MATLALVTAWDKWNERWARERLSDIRQFVDDERFAEALVLATKVQRLIPEDPTLEKMWPEFSTDTLIATDQDGVDISIRGWNAPNDGWGHIGTTPIGRVRVPKNPLHWKLSKKDHATLVLLRTTAQNEMKFRLEKSNGGQFSGMARVTGGTTIVTLGGLAHIDRLPVGEYLIDRCEVTNRQFQEFVDGGGYASQRFWKQPFAKGDSSLSWEDAMAEFVDSTGNPGPAGWKSGRFPEGEDDHPVRGISWFEAAAYAESIGKRLPSVYHWARAANLWDATYIVPLSNFGLEKPAPVGHYPGVGKYGLFDMAGNIKEWCWNSAGEGNRYILGGAWDEPKYMFNYPDVQRPFMRSETFGFRCVKILLEGSDTREIDHEIIRMQRDFSGVQPISDEVFEIYKRNFSYDEDRPLKRTVLFKREAKGYSHEKIEFDAAYGNERVTAHFYYPSDTLPPFQTVIYFPPAFVLHQKSFNEKVLPKHIAFIVQNGRAVLYPIYKGTFDRGTSLTMVVPAATLLYRDHVFAWSKDLSRCIDYLETRPDVDHEKLAYYGYSWGADMGTIFPAVENRLKVSILSGTGFNEQEAIEDVDQITYVRRVTIPTLMLNGKYNTFYPIELAVQPLFDLLGTPDADKSLHLFDSGQFIPPKDLTKETTAWLDKYLGPVEPRID